MTDEEIEEAVDKIKNNASADRRKYEEMVFSFIDKLVKERNAYRHLLEREMKRHAEFMVV